MAAMLSACGPTDGDKAAKAEPPAAVAAAPIKQASSPVPTVEINLSSPDLAVKSWWRIMDMRMQFELETCNFYKAKRDEVHQQLMKIAQESAYRDLEKWINTPCVLERFSREIQEVKMETETRAVVFVKIANATPIPEGAVPDADDKKRRAEGERFKYLLEKSADGWKISQVYRYYEFAKKYLNKDPWEAVYEPDQPPHVPTSVLGTQ